MTKKESENKAMDKNSPPKKRPWWRRGLRILGRTFLIIVIILILLLLFVRSPWGQDIIIGKLTNYVSDKTHTEVVVKKLFITFSGKIDLQGLYLEDQQGDTLIYSKELKATVPLWPIIKGEPISLNRVEWDGLRANISRKDSIDGFNYQFLIDAFASDSTETEPDSTESEPLKIALGSIDFSDFKVNYDDQVSGIKALLDLGKFHFQGRNFNLEKMRFQIEEIAFKNTKITYEQTKPFAPATEEPDSTESTLPFVSVHNLKLKNVIIHYNSVPDHITADANLTDFLLQVPKADLANQDIEVGQLALLNSAVKLYMETSGKEKTIPKESVTKKTEQEDDLIWPDWNVHIKSIVLQNNYLHYQTGKKPKILNHFDPDYIDLKDFNFKMEDIVLSKDEELQLDLKNFNFKEASGFNLKQLEFTLNLSNKNTRIKNFQFQTGNSSLTAHLSAHYNSINDFVEHPDKSIFDIDLAQFSLDPTDVFQFAPDLKTNDYFKKLSRQKVSGNIKAKGSLAEMNLPEFLVKWGKNTSIETHGKFRNITDPDKLWLALGQLNFKSIRKDVISIISEEDLGISVPQSVTLTGQVRGGLSDLKTKTQLTIPEGKIKLAAQYQNTDEIAFKGVLDVENLDLGKILQNPEIGQIAFTLKTSGQGNSLNDLNAKLSSAFSKLEYNDYDFSALKLNGEMRQGKGDIALTYKDYNLDLDLNSKIDLDSISQKIAINLNLNGADLYALGLMDKKIKAKLLMTVQMESEKDHLNLNSQISEGTMVYNKNTYHLGKVHLSALLHKDSTAVDISSTFLNGELRSNANIDKLSSALENHFKRYFSDSIAPKIDTLVNPVRLKLNMDFTPNDLLTNIFVPEIKSMDTLKLKVNYKQQKNLLTAQMSLPYLDYADKTIDSLQFNLDATKNTGKFKFGFKKLNAGAFVMNPTFFAGNLQNGLLTVNFNSLDEKGKEFYVSQTEISGKNKHLTIHIIPDNLVLQGEDWTIPEDNELVIEKDKINAHNFVFSHQSQLLKIANDLIKTKKDNIGIGFKNFKLATFMALFNADDYLAKGNLQGNIVVVNPLDKLGLIADFGIDSLQVLKVPMGNLSLKAFSNQENHYKFKMGLKGDDVDLDLHGNYVVEEEAHFKLNLNLNKFGFKTIDELAGANIEEGSGYLSGNITAGGAVASLKYKGYLKFNKASFKISQLNSKFYLNEDKIALDNDGITLNNFSIEDGKHNKFFIDGAISTEDITDPEFDLYLKANDFQPINSTKKDNDDFYGTVNFNLEGTVKGKTSFPIVDMDIDVNKNTDFTYVLPKSQAAIEKRDGIVEFVNKEHPDDILTRTDDSTKAVKIAGIQLHARINLDKEAQFGVIIDPLTGDNIEISGEGALDFRISRNGQMSLTGRYVINDGHYKMSLYNLVKREFSFKKGSTLIWNGDPMDADLNVTAIYEIKTSASGLMASQTSGATTEEKNKYKQVLPFLVSLNVNGTIDQPKLNFALGMPEDSKGAIGGTVYSQINQLNEEDQGELNKQVFSLLVMNRFYPEAGSDGSQGGVTSLARDNLNQALSDQLNAFSDKLMGDTGIELDFGLNSYTDYQGKSAQDRTDLNVSAQKKLFNDRLVVKAGTDVNVQGETRSGEENPLLGNMSIEYKLTKDGRWRIRGFRKNEYENVIDGQVFVNGIGLIFQRQFNQFNELWKSFFGNPETKKEKKNKPHKSSSKKKSSPVEKKTEKSKKQTN